MATLQEVKDAITQLATDTTAAQASIATGFQALIDDINAIKAGGAATPADLDALVTSIQGLDAQVKAIPVPAVPA